MNEPTPIGEQNDRPDEYKPDGTTFKLDDVKLGSRWRHYRGTEYTIKSVSRWSTNGPDEGRAVIEYQSDEAPLPCTRFADEFLDGRFRPIDPDELHEDIARIVVPEKFEKESE